jgi:hypothetical protein
MNDKRLITNKLKYIALLVLPSLGGAGGGHAQAIIDAEFRPRTELRSGFNQPLADTLKPSFVTQQRTRLNFNYTGEQLNARITLQDARVFGETDTKGSSTGTLGIYEAWTELLLFNGIRFKIGRQGIQFEDGRLFSLSPWSNTGNSHDLMQLLYKRDGLDVQLGYAYNNQKALNADSVYYSVSKMYKQLAFLHLTKTLTIGLDLSLLGVDEGFQTSKTNLDLYHRYTIGRHTYIEEERASVWMLPNCLLPNREKHGHSRFECVFVGNQS